MPNICYVVLSDMHLGEEDSLLTCLKQNTDIDPLSPSEVMVKLVEGLRFLISTNSTNQKPTLILAGDILEMALCTTNLAAMVFARFIELIMPEGDELFDEIIYIPGNHDHHLWESARESQYEQYIRNTGISHKLNAPYHCTRLCADPEYRVPISLLTTIAQEYPHLKAKEFKVRAAYPNLGLVNGDKSKCVIVSHGHYTEPLYKLLTNLRTLVFKDRAQPKEIWDFEAENFAWIDFFWSAMGRSGEAGRTVEAVYEAMQNPVRFREILNGVAENIAENYDVPGIPGNRLERRALQILFNKLADKLENSERRSDGALTSEVEDGLQWYLTEPVLKQMGHDDKTETLTLSDTSFIFGHTHKPFARNIMIDGQGTCVDCYNTGGWIVETTSPKPVHGGAITLLDENLNIAQLRIYNEASSPDEYSVKIDKLEGSENLNNALADNLESNAELDTNPVWKELSKTIAEQIEIRAQIFRGRIMVSDC